MISNKHLLVKLKAMHEDLSDTKLKALLQRIRIISHIINTSPSIFEVQITPPEVRRLCEKRHVPLPHTIIALMKKIFPNLTSTRVRIEGDGRVRLYSLGTVEEARKHLNSYVGVDLDQ